MLLNRNNGFLKEGFRLYKLEILNWGTFNQRIWVLQPEGHTTLLTGANGSGKSTLVDALVTLLVSPRKRAYNIASGSERRRERDILSYMLGAYARLWNETIADHQIQYLRDPNSYSVLLAIFVNERTNQVVTLAQIFFMPEDKVRTYYIIADTPLSVAEHFRISGNMLDHVRLLRKEGIEVHSEFSAYEAAFQRYISFRSEDALNTVFNQIVSLKDIPSLNMFIREYMLEAGEVDMKIEALTANFREATYAHDLVLKAERQLDALEPMMKDATQFRTIASRISDLEQAERLIPYYFTEIALDLLAHALAYEAGQYNYYNEQAVQLKQRLAQARQKKEDLTLNIRTDSAGQRLEQLKHDIAESQKRLAKLQSNAAQYDKIAARLNRRGYSNLETFLALQDESQDDLQELDSQQAVLIQERDDLKIEIAELNKHRDKLVAELESLYRRKSQIPLDDLNIRNRMMQELGLSEEQLPFIGELLRVRDTRWEPALQRLLRNYGRQLLVPEHLYRPVTRYINSTNLKGRLVYHRIREDKSTPSRQMAELESVYPKLEVRPNTPFSAWLRLALIQNYDHICCETLEDFNRYTRAITLEGLIKHGAERHEKDDRSRLNDASQYVLGWDNQGKIKALEAKLSKIESALQQLTNQIQDVEQRQKKVIILYQLWQELLRYETFAEIDWHSEQGILNTLQEEQQRLLAASDRLMKLRQEIAEVEAQIAQNEADDARLNQVLGGIQNTIQGYQERQSRYEHQLREESAANLSEHRHRIEERLIDTPTLDNIAEIERKIITEFRGTLNTSRGALTTVRERLVKAMESFKRDYPVDTQEMDASTGAIEEFKRLYDNIKREGLPQHRRSFKEMLDRMVTEDMSLFLGELYDRKKHFEQSIDHLNTSLQHIQYTPSTFIRLSYADSRDQETRQFRYDLRDCFANLGDPTYDSEQAFARIRAIIEQLNDPTKERWRKKVVDVRNWLDFSAEERYLEEPDRIRETYSDSSGKSGGQKAKLAYTIMASALAYQYGLDDSQLSRNAFRFVVVDEAFSKSDEANADYAMRLFETLGLQLLVVTPLDKIHIVEPYIQVCEYVTNTPEGDDSQVFTLSREEYFAQRQALQSGHFSQ